MGSLSMVGSTINAPLSNQGTLTVLSGAGSAITGAFENTAGATLRIQVDAGFGAAVLTVAQGFTNAGVIDLAHFNNQYSGTTATLAVSSGTLVNTGTITASAGTGGGVGGTRALLTQLDNRGTLTVNAPLTISKASAQHANSGTVTLVGGDLTVIQSGAGASFTDTGVISVGAGRTLSANGQVEINGSGILTGQALGTFALQGDLIGNTQNANLFAPASRVVFNGNGTSSAPQLLEAMGRDLLNTADGFDKNFSYGAINLANNTFVRLMDNSDNSAGTAAEALYVNTLVVPPGTTLDLNGLHLYTRALQIAGTVIGGTINEFVDGGPLAFGTSLPGNISAAGEVDEWTFYGFAGRGVTLLVNPGNADSFAPLIPQLGFGGITLIGPDGTTVSSASSSGAGTNALILGQVLPASGTYRVRVQASPGHALSTGRYVISAYDATVNTAPISYGQQYNGTLATPYNADRWTFTAVAGQQVRFQWINATSSSIRFTLNGPNDFVGFANVSTSSGLITLPSSGNYTLSVNAGVAGNYAFRVDQTVLTSLELETVYHGSFAGSAQPQLFRVDLASPTILSILLEDTFAADSNELYVKFGAPPTRSDYQYRFSSPGAANQHVLVPSAEAGSWYILVYASSIPQPSQYTLVAHSSDLVVTGVTPDRYATTGDAVLTLTGAGFGATTSVSLVNKFGLVYPATSTSVASPTNLNVTFATGSVPPGMYSVTVAQADGSSVTLPNAFRVTSESDPRLITRLIVPDPIGFHIASTIYVEYTNAGDTAIPAPVLVLTATQNGIPGALMTLDASRRVSGFWTSATPEGYHQSVQILASGARSGVLEPGESATVPVYYAGWLTDLWDFSRPPIHFQLMVHLADDPSLIDWPGLSETLRPPSMPLETWEALYPVLQAQVGPTWGDYVESLELTASYLGQRGQSLTDVGRLWQHEIDIADGLSPNSRVAVTSDIVGTTPGLPLTFQRAFATTISGRYHTGPFGRGWFISRAWAVSLSVRPDGSVVVHNPDGATFLFQPDSRGGYFSFDDKILTGNGTSIPFSLTMPGGTTTRFLPDGRVDYVTDATGHRLTAGYTNGLLTRITDQSGQSLAFAYNAAGRIATVTAPTGVWTYAYDPSNQYLLSVTDPNGLLTRYAYNSDIGTATAFELMTVQHPDATQDAYQYSASGRLLSWQTGYAFSGEVVDGNGNGLGGVAITLISATNPEIQITTTTALDGSFALPAVPAGLYDLVALRAGYLADVRTGVSITGPTVLPAIVLTSSTTVLSGTIVDPQGLPLRAARITVFDEAGRTFGTVLSADDGSFVIDTAWGTGLSLQVVVPGALAPKVIDNLTVPPGSAIALGNIDPASNTLGATYNGILDALDPSSWLLKLSKPLVEPRPDELTVGQIPPLGDCTDCAGEHQDVVFALIAQQQNWENVDQLQTAANQATIGTIGLITTKFAIAVLTSEALAIADGLLALKLGLSNPGILGSVGKPLLNPVC